MLAKNHGMNVNAWFFASLFAGCAANFFCVGGQQVFIASILFSRMYGLLTPISFV
jgi:hypothetical protein